MRLLAIDFGTSNTVAALAVDGQAPRTVAIDSSPLLPSAVFVAADGTVTVGREAQRRARVDPTRFEPNPKRRIDDGELLLGDRVVEVVDLIAAVLRTVAAEVRRQLGGTMPEEVRLTHPAGWGANRQNTLVTAARRAGLGTNLVLVPEPVAAAAQYTQLPGRALPPGGCLAVYDLGGGTLDIAVVGRMDRGFHVLAEGGLADLGGLDFDQALLDHVGRAAADVDAGRWSAILHPVDPTSRRASRAVAEDVRIGKEALSRYPQTEVALPDPFVDAHLTRSEFEALIRPNLMRSVDVLDDTLRRAGAGPDRLAGVFLVGGSSRIPLVATLIAQRLGVVPVALDQPETAVALGALLVPVARDGNRTVDLGGGAPWPPAAGPGYRQAAPVRPGAVPPVGAGPVHGPGPLPPAVPGGNGGNGGRNRGRTAAILAAAAVVLVAAIVLIVVRPFGGGTADPPLQPTGSVTASPTATTTPGTTTPSTASPTTGLGPGGLFTSAELAFLGPAASSLANCTAVTEAFNAAVPKGFRVDGSVTRCAMGESTLASTNLAYNQVLVYMIDAGDPQRVTALLDAVADNRSSGDMADYDADKTFTAGDVTGRYVVGYGVPGLGAQPSGRGVSAFAWTYHDQQYVGIIVALNGAAQSDLTGFWQAKFKPQG